MTHTPKCVFCKLNEPTYDHESHGYNSSCYPCFELNHHLAGHFHVHTMHLTQAVFTMGILTGRRCTKHDCGEILLPAFRSPVTDWHTVRPTLDRRTM